MDDFETKKPARSGGASASSRTTTNPRWADIRTRSVLDFVNRVARAMTGESNPAHQDKALRAGLYDMALHDGRGFVWQSLEVNERMALGEWAKTFRQPEPGTVELFTTRAEWDGFCEAMRKVRDPKEPMTDRAALLRWDQGIEARQRQNAERRGWI